jgi:hypothetical protein
VRTVYSSYLDETVQQGTTTLLPQLVKWSKVGPGATVEVDAVGGSLGRKSLAGRRQSYFSLGALKQEGAAVVF